MDAAVDTTDTIHGAEDDDPVQLLQADTEWQFFIRCTTSTAFTPTSTTSAFSAAPPISIWRL